MFKNRLEDYRDTALKILRLTSSAIGVSLDIEKKNYKYKHTHLQFSHATHYTRAIHFFHALNMKVELKAFYGLQTSISMFKPEGRQNF